MAQKTRQIHVGPVAVGFPVLADAKNRIRVGEQFHRVDRIVASGMHDPWGDILEQPPLERLRGRELTVRDETVYVRLLDEHKSLRSPWCRKGISF